MKLTPAVLKTVRALKEVVEAYEEISSARMRKVKLGVLSNRDYLDGLRKVYTQINYSYTHEKGRIGGARKTNGKTIYVLLSANTGLYGNVINDLLHKFLTDLSGNTTDDIAIVGKLGKRYFDQSAPNRAYTYFSLSDTIQDSTNTQLIFDFLVNYATIILYHGKFKDILTQAPNAVSITGDLYHDATATSIVTERFIFEPSLEEVMAFFEQKILKALFSQSIFESNLSKYASRMINLNMALESITSTINSYALRLSKQHHTALDTEQRRTISNLLAVKNYD